MRKCVGLAAVAMCPSVYMISIHPPALAVSIEVGIVSCWAVLCCCFYTPLRAIEADVRNAPDIVDLNVRYPVESSAGIGERSGEGGRLLRSKARDAAEDTLSIWGRGVAN